MIIRVTVRPNAHTTQIEKITDKEYHALIAAPANKNKANIELTKALARYFKKSSAAIRIKNQTSRKKIVEIRD